jgi:hypothetical protein
MSHIDDWSKDKGEGDIDTDIPESPEVFAKAIQRERRNWENAFKVLGSLIK